MRVGKSFPWFIIFVLLVACAAGLYHIRSQSIWFDEGWSAYAAVQPTLLGAWNADQTNPPIYYVLLNIFAHFTGDSELALRYFSLLWGLFSVALVYQLAARLFNRRSGLFSALLAALSPLLWWASQEARMYTLLAALLLLCALAWHEVRRSTSWRWWCVLWAAELVLLYAHNTGPVVALWLNLVTLIAWLLHRSVRNLRPAPLRWLIGQAVVAVVWLPYFISRFVLLSGANDAVSSTSPLTVDMLARLWQVLWTGVWTLVGYEPLLVILSSLILIITLLVIPWRNRSARWLLLHVGLLTSGLWLGLTILGNEIHGRYLVMFAPLLLVVLGAGLAQVRLARLSLPLFGITFLAVIHFVTVNPAYQHDDARGMTRYYADNLTAEDTVLMWSYADRYELAYYWHRLGVQARRVTLPEGEDLDVVLPLLPTSGDVALNTWYVQRADYRGMIGCLLGNGTINEPEVIDFYGMTNRLFDDPFLRPLVMNPVQASLNMASLSAIGEINPASADSALCLPIQITLTQPMSADLKAAVRIRNPLGWEIVSADAIFADRIQRTSSQLPGGAVLTAFPLLRLPYGAPSGQYTVQIRIYDEVSQPSGYNLTTADGQIRPDILVGMSRTTGSNWVNVRPPDNLISTAVNSDLTLKQVSLNTPTLTNGDFLQISVLWQGEGTIPALFLSDPQAGWRTEIPAPEYAQRDIILLDWRSAQIPLDAPSGRAQLTLPDGTVIASVDIAATPINTSQPTFENAVDVDIPGIGTLVGYSLDGDITDRSQPLELTLVWQALQTSSSSYTVFAHFITDDGQILAQSDSRPAQGARPTTGWRPGEYIVDTHSLTFNNTLPSESARLIVGMYDADTGVRVKLVEGQDYIDLRLP